MKNFFPGKFHTHTHFSQPLFFRVVKEDAVQPNFVLFDFVLEISRFASKLSNGWSPYNPVIGIINRILSQI